MSPFPNVGRRKRFVSLTTFRRDGTPVATPMWFGWNANGVYVATHATAGKVARIAANAQVSIAPCTPSGRVTGSERGGHARLLEGDDRARAERAIARRYPVPAALLRRTMLRRGHGRPPVYFEISDG